MKLFLKSYQADVNLTNKNNRFFWKREQWAKKTSLMENKCNILS